MNNVKKIVITGPESTGKSSICEFLAKEFNTVCVPEFAREYVENLNRKYTYNDVQYIAKKQILLENEFLKRANKILFVDTSLIITKVWFDVVFKKIPQWFEQKILENLADFYLLCNTDIEWIPDSVRENGGAMREILFDRYKRELIAYDVNFEIVQGKNKLRLGNALINVQNYLKISRVND